MFQPFVSDKDLAKAASDKIKELDTPNEKVKALAIKYHLDLKKKLDNELKQKMKTLTIEYEKQFKPIYETIGEIASGARPVTADEAKGVENILNEEEKTKLEEYLQPSQIKNYWADALINNATIGGLVTEKDEEAFDHITSVTYHEEEAVDDFEITFHFSPNDFFTNTTLKCLVKMKDDEPNEVVGTTIEWKEGKNLTKKVITKKQKNKKTKQTRTITKEEDCDSFFNIFKSAVISKDDDSSIDRVNTTHDIGRTIIEEVVPYSLECFLGVREDAYDEEDLEDMKDIDEDEDDDEDEPPASKKKTKAIPNKTTSPPPPNTTNTTGNTADGQKPECKQQ